jgi:hypothetical protein
MAIFNFTNPGQYGSAYFTLETVPNNQGFFDSSSFPNAQGYYSNFTNLNESYIVTSSYVFGVVVPPGSSSFEFNPSNSAMPTGSLYFRGTGGIGITVDTYSGSYVVSPSQGYNGKVLNTFPLTPVPNFQARVAANSGSYEALSCQNTVLADIGTEILSSASLLVTPNGYTEGVLFSTLPNSSSGDFTVTRATTATRVNAAGLVELVPYNLFTYSEQFNNADWFKLNSVVTANVITAPNGTMTADKLALTAGTNPLANDSTGLYKFTSIPSGVYTYSIYLKAGERNIARWRDGGFSGAYLVVNLTDGTFTNGQPSRFVNPQVVSVGDGWWLVSFTTGIITNPSAYPLRFGDTGQTGDGVSGGYIWGAQLVEGTSALDYQATETRLNIPRLDYSLGSCPNILLEPQRTNSIRNSTMVGAVTGSPGTIPTNWVAFDTGGLTRSVVNLGTENGIQYIDLRFNGTATGIFIRYGFDSNSQINASVGQAWTGTTYVKVLSTSLVPNSYVLRHREATAAGTLTADAETSFTPDGTLKRYAFTRTTTGATTERINFQIQFNLTIGQTYDFTIRIAAPQMELGAYATSYIPTTSATVTRNADVISRGNLYTNNRITSAGGTWFVDLRNNISRTRDAFAAGIFIGNASDGVGSNGFAFTYAASISRIQIRKVLGGSTTILYTTTTDTAKITIKWDGSTADIFQNGVKVISATAFTSTNMEWLVAQAQDVPKFINSMALFPVPLSDSQCIELTGGGYDTPELAYASLGLTSESPLYLNQSVNSLIF